jgi:hypothetical protein
VRFRWRWRNGAGWGSGERIGVADDGGRNDGADAVGRATVNRHWPDPAAPTIRGDEPGPAPLPQRLRP